MPPDRRCFRCNRVGVFYPERLKQLRLAQVKRRQRWAPKDDGYWDEMVGNDRVAELEKRLRCSDCGNRVNNSLRVLKLPPHA